MELRIPYGHPGPQDVSHGLAVILYEMTVPALQPAWGIGALTRPWIPHGIHHVSPDAICHAVSPALHTAYEIKHIIPHENPHEVPDICHRTPHIEPMITCGMSGPGFNLEWGPVSRTTSDLPHGVSNGTPDPVRDHGSCIQSPMEPRIPGEIRHRIPHWVAVRPRPKGTSLRQ